jgi:cytochrome oxidase assembly protein ShyY1
VSTDLRPLLAPRLWGLHLLAVLATTAAVLLGLWQYGVWQTHREDKTASLVHEAPQPLDGVLTADQAFPAAAVGRPVTFSGRWLPQDTFYVADRELRGRTGLWVVTPVEVCDRGGSCAGRPAILVVRGWTPRRAQAPAAPTGAVRVTGWLQPGEGSGSADPDPTDDVLPQLRIADVVQRVDQDLYGGYVVAKKEVSASSTSRDGLEPVTPASLPKPDTSTALRNLLYALEWWVFGGFAVFLWVRWCRDELERDRDDHGTAGSLEPAGRPEESQVTGVRSGS